MKRLIMLAMVVGVLLLGGCGYDGVARLVHKDGEKLIPIETIAFNVSERRQEVIYFFRDADTGERSELFKLTDCKVLDEDNWEGVTNDDWDCHGKLRLLLCKVTVTDGKFKLEEDYYKYCSSVSWWTWYFKTDPPMVNTHPSWFLLFLWNRLIGWELGRFIFLAILIGIFISYWLKDIIEDGVSGIKYTLGRIDETLDRIDDHITEKE